MTAPVTFPNRSIASGAKTTFWRSSPGDLSLAITEAWSWGHHQPETGCTNPALVINVLRDARDRAGVFG